MLVMNAMIFVDRMYVAQYNLTQFAAMMPASFLATAIASFFVGIIGYVSVLVAQCYGARRYQDCSASMWQGVYLSMFFTFLLIMFSMVSSNIFKVMGHDGDLLKFEMEYFFLIILANCIQLFSTAFSSFYCGIGDTKITMYVGIATNIVNMVLTWLLVFGKYGLPEMGMFQYQILRNYHFNRVLLHKLLKFGLFSGIQSFVDIGYFSILFIIIGMTGEFALTCVNITVAIEAAFILPLIGITTAVGIIAGQERGANRLNNIPIVIKKGIIIGICYNLLIISMCNFLPEFLIAIFNSEQDKEKFLLINNVTIPLVRLTSLWIVLDMIHLIIGSVLEAVGDTRFMMVMYAVVPFLFYVILPYVLCVVASLSLSWLWIALIGYRVVLLLLVTNRFLGGKWKGINVI
ncbi:MAG: norM 3 [Sporomusa sp.]|nr:norM 3 [Sporomusa sp.]